MSIFRRVLVTLLMIPLVWGCGEQEGASPEALRSPKVFVGDDASLKTAQYASSTGCPEVACVIGTMGCDVDGHQVPCIQNPDEPIGCGMYDYDGAQGCGNETFCYNGECMSPDNIPLPTVSSDPEWESLSNHASVAFPVDLSESVQVIPYEAFINALRASDFTEATNEDLDLATQIVSEGNNLNVLGVSATIQEEDAFSGDIFLVALDPTLPMGGSSTMEIRSYFVAVMPGLSGPTSWVGESPAFLATGGTASSSLGCCLGGQPGLSCGFGWNGTGGLPGPDIEGGGGPCPVGLADCPFPWGSTLDNHIYTDPDTMPFRTGTGTAVEPDHSGRSHTRVMRGNGMPAVYMYATKDRSVHEGLYNEEPVTVLEALFPPPLFCEKCNVALCRQDTTTDPTKSDFNGSSACGIPIDAEEVPEHCQQMTPQGVGGLDCAGLFDNMGREFDPTSVCGGFISMTNTSMIGSDGNPGVGTCNGRVTPNWCTMSYQEGSDCDCDNDCQVARQEFMSWFYGCSGGAAGNQPGLGVTCGEDGTVCVDSDGSGRSICYGCNDDGACRAYEKSSWVDSRYASSGGKAIAADANGNCPDHYVPTPGTSVTFCLPLAGAAGTQSTTTNTTTNGSNGGKQTAAKAPPTSSSSDDEGGEGKEPAEEKTAGTTNKKVISKDKPRNDRGVESHWPVTTPVDPKKVAQPLSHDSGGSGSGPSKFKRVGGKPKRDSGSPEKSDASVAEGDPVLLSTGALVVSHKDLSFAGPVQPLEFERYYDSTSEDRSVLGSNWSHNFDSRVIPIRPGNMPNWAPSYCIAYAPTTTCAFVQYPGGGKKLFIKSPGDPNHLFYPQAGSSETLRMDGDSWQLQSLDGRMRLYGEFGYLISDRDRFGNGYSVEYEPTPVYSLLQRYCNKTTKFAVRSTGLLGGFTGGGQTSSQLDPRVCRALAAMFGDQTEPIVSVDGWLPYEEEEEGSSNYAPALVLPGDGPFTQSNERLKIRNLFPFDRDARTYVQDLIGKYPNPLDGNNERITEIEVNNHLPSGDRKFRPKLVRDDLGRTLEFEYYEDPSDKVTYGLLKKVTGPSAITSVSYDYDRPSDYPQRLQESFLTRVDRVDGAVGEGLVQQEARSFDFVYNWPSTSNFESYPTYAQSVYDLYFDYFSTFNGCTWGEGLAAAVCRPGSISGGGSSGVKPTTICGVGPGGEGEFYDDGGVAGETSNFGTIGTCSIGNLAEMPESPCYLATRSQEDYISAVADNLIMLTRNNVVEVASRYEADPDAVAFDRVTVQRYGGLDNGEYGLFAQSNRTSYAGWDGVDYPEFSFEYIFPQPTNTSTTTPGDETDNSSLPSSLLSRYPLEDAHVSWDVIDPCILNQSCGGVPGGSIPGHGSCGDGYAWPPHETAFCDSNEAMRTTLELPGIFQTFDYYELGTQPGDDANHPRIYRSRLTCRQLASAHLGDATHNGLLKEQNEGTGDWELLDGSRDQIRDDSRRICAWGSVMDRDGDKRYVGLNFRGQALVEAVEVDGDLLVTETLYNADGLVLEERDTTLSTDTWTETDGWTDYTYQEIDPDGASGWNEWLSFWWMRRMNLTSVRNYPRSNPGEEVLVHEWDAANNTFDGEQLEWTETALSYEPLFNQVEEVTISSQSVGGTPEVLQKVSYDFDYQEYSTAQWPLVYAALQETQAWGWRLPIGEDPETLFQNWRLPKYFYGEDLNGDGIIGFANFGTSSAMAIRAFPVRMIVENPRADVSDPDWMKQRITHVWPSPHGQVSRIEEPSGAITVLEYYPRDQHTFGQHPLVEDTYSSHHNSGMLARTLQLRFTRDYSDSEAGPFDAPVPLAQSVCSDLSGPYQWISPGGCSAGGAMALANMGIPSEVRDELLLAAKDPADPSARPWIITSFNYNVAGGVHDILEDGLQTTIIRDTDGRPRQIIDPQGTQTTLSRDLEGDVTKVEVYEVNAGESDTLLGRVHYQYDAEGTVLTRCEDVNDGGCDGAFDLSNLLDYNAARVTVAPDYLLTTYRYTPEGKLHRMRDASGVETLFDYDERGLLLSRRTEGGANAVGDTDEARQVEYVYDIYGQVTDVKYGTSTTRSTYNSYDEVYAYDGMGRVKSMTDGFGASWQFAWSPRGTLTAYKQDFTPYAVTSGVDAATADHEVFISYDGFGRTTHKRMHDTLLSALDYDLYGFVRHQEVRPVGTAPGNGRRQWMTYDAMGNLVWSMDEQGNQSISVANSSDRITASAAIRVDSETASSTPVYLTTSNRTTYDLGWYPSSVENIGHNEELQQHAFVYNSVGDLLAYHNPENEITNFEHNLLGWREQVSQPSSVGASASVVSDYVYNARGQVLELYEPGEPGGVTEFAYNNFGERIERILPMDPGRPFDTLTYDGYGRIAKAKLHNSGTSGDFEQLSWTHYSHGNGVREVLTNWDNAPTSSGLLRSVNYDALGRVTEASEYNLMLAEAVGSTNVRRVSHEYQYDDMGRTLAQIQRIYDGTTLLSTKTTGAAFNADGQGRWTRELTYPSGTRWDYEQDALGRLGSMTEVSIEGVTSGADGAIDFNWVGGLYKGRAQTYNSTAGLPDPLREVRSFDGMGRRTEIAYSAVDLDSSGAPTNATWGDDYCLGTWASGCAAPLLDVELKYDVMGKLVSSRKQYGHPVQGGPPGYALMSHRKRWRGYNYSARGFLENEWISDSVTDVEHDSLINHQVVTSDIEQVGDGPGEKWNWLRESGAGDLIAIEQADNTSNKRWQHTNASAATAGARDPGHLLDTVVVDGASRAISHDGRGRITDDGNFEYVYDPFNRLVAASPSGTSSFSESYTYDARGRLIEVYDHAETERREQVYDGPQMIASYLEGNLDWEATWGPGLDHLLQWRHVSAAGGERTYIPLRDHRNNVVGLWDTDAASLTGLADFSAQGRMTLFNDDETVSCQEEGSGLVCGQLAGAFPFGFNSAWRSRATGLVSMRHRWYSPLLGQFVSHDPLEYIDSKNMYAFAALDPVNGWDPWGLKNDQFAKKHGINEDPVWKGLPEEQKSRVREKVEEAEKQQQIAKEMQRRAGKPGDRCVSGSCLSNDPEQDSERYLGQMLLGAFKAIVGGIPLFWDGHKNGAPTVPKELQPSNDAQANGALVADAVGISRGVNRAIRSPKGKRPRGKKVPCESCFVPNTPVLMCDGSTKPIGEVEIGDLVVSKNERTGEVDCKEVTQIHDSVEAGLYELTVLDLYSGQRTLIVATGAHPFITVLQGAKRAEFLRTGELLQGPWGERFVLEEKRPLAASSRVLNLGVDDFHTYFIGKQGVWVHNCYETSISTLPDGRVRQVRRHKDLQSEFSVVEFNPRTGELYVSNYETHVSNRGGGRDANGLTYGNRFLKSSIEEAIATFGDVRSISGHPMNQNSIPPGLDTVQVRDAILHTGRYEVMSSLGFTEVNVSVDGLSYIVSFSKP